MTSPTRLASGSPDLAAQFSCATPQKRWAAAMVACEIAAFSAGLEAEVVASSLSILRGSDGDPAVARDTLNALTNAHDDAYLQLSEKNDAPMTRAALEHFSRARAAAALACALEGDEGQLDEAVYEALSAVEDQSDFVRRLGQVLT